MVDPASQGGGGPNAHSQHAAASGAVTPLRVTRSMRGRGYQLTPSSNQVTGRTRRGIRETPPPVPQSSNHGSPVNPTPHGGAYTAPTSVRATASAQGQRWAAMDTYRHFDDHIRQDARGVKGMVDDFVAVDELYIAKLHGFLDEIKNLEVNHVKHKAQQLKLLDQAEASIKDREENISVKGYSFRNANDFLAERKKARDKIRNEFYEISYNSFIKQYQKLQRIKTCVELIRLGRPVLWNAWGGASAKGKDPQVPRQGSKQGGTTRKPCASLTMTKEYFHSVKQALVTQLIKQGSGLAGMRQAELIKWYVEQQKQKNSYSNEVEVEVETDYIRAIIEYLIEKEALLIVLDNGTDMAADRILAVAPNYVETPGTVAPDAEGGDTASASAEGGDQAP